VGVFERRRVSSLDEPLSLSFESDVF